MGKARKIKPSNEQLKVPLHQQIYDSAYVKNKNRVKVRNRQEEEDSVIDSKLSEKILHQARKQQEELEEEAGSSDQRLSNLSIDEEGNSSEDDQTIGCDDGFDHYENIVVNEEDEKALEVFMNKNPAPRLTLADIILEKITEKQTELQTQLSDGTSIPLQDLDPKVKQMYEGVKEVLTKYRSGKLPKAFKVIPKLRNWEQILYITDPNCWSAAAMYMATRIFASNLKEKMAQRFYNLVLLPRIRDDISEYKQLNFHLYQALRKALFKPGAFMKGILLPLCESGTCTLREAIIVGSVVGRNSIPMLHSAAAMLKLAEMEYTGANSIFLRILFDKKYALPYRVVDAVVFHFLRFERDKREMPVLWHQSLLTFAQRYKSDISSEQKEALLKLLRYQTHSSITPEIRRELQSAKCRDTEVSIPDMC